MHALPQSPSHRHGRAALYGMQVLWSRRVFSCGNLDHDVWSAASYREGEDTEASGGVIVCDACKAKRAEEVVFTVSMPRRWWNPAIILGKKRVTIRKHLCRPCFDRGVVLLGKKGVECVDEDSGLTFETVHLQAGGES